tara:strand:- start:1063 stop:1437 length:375 start_codon:yes stop_codon:yes gene_type:complete
MEFALSQFDLMEKIGQEVNKVREIEGNKRKFREVIWNIRDLKNVVEEYYPPCPTNDSLFINHLFVISHCINEDDDGELPEIFIVDEDGDPYMRVLCDRQKPRDYFSWGSFYENGGVGGFRDPMY